MAEPMDAKLSSKARWQLMFLLRRSPVYKPSYRSRLEQARCELIPAASPCVIIDRQRIEASQPKTGGMVGVGSGTRAICSLYPTQLHRAGPA